VANHPGRLEARSPTGQLGWLLRDSTQKLFARILAAECERYVAGFGGALDNFGREAVVRNGYQPVRYIETGIGFVGVRVPKVRSRTREAAVFRSAIVPRYLRCTHPHMRDSVWRYLYGLWLCDLNQVLAATLGARAAHLASTVPESAKRAWSDISRQWRYAPAGRVVEVWAESVSPDPSSGLGSIFVAIGADGAGVLSLLAIDHSGGDADGRWATIAGNLAQRGLQRPERVHAGTWAAGFGEALRFHTPELTATAA